MHENFCEFLRENAMKLINFKKKKMELLTKEQQESYENAKTCYICKEKFENKGLSPATLLKKRLWHRCFPVNFEKFLTTDFYRIPLGDCF